MNEFDGQSVTTANNVAVTSAAEELEEKKEQAFEEKVSQLYRFLLQPIIDLSRNP
ncbi:hypothetical protein PI125_g13913 [Phytophthora idaei]|nr:hypothetical protein PI125_g13913 [Phytophthora idaei]